MTTNRPNRTALLEARSRLEGRVDQMRELVRAADSITERDELMSYLRSVRSLRIDQLRKVDNALTHSRSRNA